MPRHALSDPFRPGMGYRALRVVRVRESGYVRTPRCRLLRFQWHTRAGEPIRTRLPRCDYTVGSKLERGTIQPVFRPPDA
jgi:hypothetical protein